MIFTPPEPKWTKREECLYAAYDGALRKQTELATRAECAEAANEQLSEIVLWLLWWTGLVPLQLAGEDEPEERWAA